MSADTLEGIRGVFFSATKRYEYLTTLGRGGMGVVFKCRDLELADTVVAKVMFPDFNMDPEERFLRLRREVSVNRRIKHPNVARIYDIGQAGGLSFLTMEFVPGVPLSQVVEEFAPLSACRAVPILRQIAYGVSAAHQAGVVHRDLKPANIMVDSDGAVTILDFGLAAIQAGPRMTQQGVAIGTPAYMAPEQARGRPPDHRSDIYSIGVVAYECLTGKLPFTGSTALEIVMSVMTDPVPLEPLTREGVSEPLTRIVLRCLSKEPGGRFQSAEELAAALGLAHDSGKVVTPVLNEATPPVQLLDAGPPDLDVTRAPTAATRLVPAVGAENPVLQSEDAQPTRPTERKTSQILVVDDDAEFRKLVTLHLSGAGFVAVEASSGEHALELMQTIPFDAVLLDVKMPRLDGFDTLRVIKSQKRFASLPVIMMSTFPERNRLAFAIQAGATAFLAKPLDLAALDRQLGQLFALRKRLSG